MVRCAARCSHLAISQTSCCTRSTHGASLWLFAALLGLLLASAQAQFGTETGPQLFGPKNVLVKYKDPKCSKEVDGQGSTQSWTRVPGAGNCYELTMGMLCPFRCTVNLGCQFDTGSGVIVDRFSSGSSCQGSALGSPEPFASHLYWLEAEMLFLGGCVSAGNGDSDGYLKFQSPLTPGFFPNCSRFGAVMPGADPTAFLYESLYTLQFYRDLSCQEPYVWDRFSDRPTSRFIWRLYRGAQYCYDMVDATPRPEGTPKSTEFDINNWRMGCGNQDSKGPGTEIKQYVGPKCTSGETSPMQWKDVFYPMNFPGLMDLLGGKCVLWGKYRVKFDRPFSKEDYPDCSDYACKEGFCSGGRIRAEDDVRGEVYSGSIRTSGADPALAASASAPSTVSVALLLLSAACAALLS